MYEALTNAAVVILIIVFVLRRRSREPSTDADKRVSGVSSIADVDTESVADDNDMRPVPVKGKDWSNVSVVGGGVRAMCE
jgi:hypothetical protein